MMEEAMPEMMRLMNHLSRFDTPEIRALAKRPGAQHDLRTGDGDVTLEEAIASYPGSKVIRPKHDARQVPPDDNESVFSISERHLDLMPPSHLRRGLLGVPGAAFLWLALMMLWSLCSMLVAEIAEGRFTFGGAALTVIFSPVAAFFAWLFWHAFLSFDWFHYRANPIRFDRERRMVHVWRSRRAGGCYSVPWDDNLLLVRGGRDSEGNARAPNLTFLCVDPDTRRIRRRIAVGKRPYEEAQADALCEYIYRFMEQGRSAVPAPHSLASMTPSIAYSFNAWFKFTDIAEWRRKGEWTVGDWGITLALAPFHLLLSLSHFIAILTGRTPKWPAEMQ